MPSIARRRTRQRRGVFLAVAALVAALVAAGLAVPAAHAYGGATLYTPNVATNPDDRVSYPHAIRLENSGTYNGRILATFERRTTTPNDEALGTVTDPGNGWIIKQSTDGGATFSTLSVITPAEHQTWPYTVQPHLLELSQPSGSYPAGTLLLGVVLSDLGTTETRMQIYRSTDHGATWGHAGNVITTGSGLPRVWEPHLRQLDNGTVAVYYAHEAQGNGPRSQTIEHKLSTDGGSTWSGITVDWRFPDDPAYLDDRPGMPTVTKMGNGSYIMAIESCGFPGEYCQLRVKTSTDGLTWGSGPTDLGTRVVATSGHGISGNPYITWTPSGGPNGRVLLVAGEITNSLKDYAATGNTRQTIFTNDNYGVGEWSELTAPVKWISGGTQSGYRSSILPSSAGDTIQYFTSSWTGSGFRNSIVYGTANSGVLPYTDPFDAGTDVGFQTYGGTWSVNTGGVYQATSSGAGEKSLFGTTAWYDYKVESDVRLDAAGQAGLLIRVTNPRIGADAHRGYYVGLSSTSNGVFIGRQNDNWTQLGALRSVPGGVATGTWYHLSVRAVGCTFTVTAQAVGGTATSFSESDPGCQLFGQAGVRMNGTPASWRDLSATAYNDTTAPSAVTGLAVGTGRMHAIPLTWNASTDATGSVRYRVYASTNSSVPLVSTNLVGTTTATQFRHGPLPAGTSRYYRVVAVDGSGNAGTASSVVSATTQARNVSDVDNDGRDDAVVFTQGSTNDVYVAKSSGSAFGTAGKWHDWFSLTGEVPFTGDANGDGLADVITFTRGTDADVFVGLSNGSSSFGTGAKWHDFFAIGTEFPLVGDFNGDGKTDIVTFTRGTSHDVYVALSNGTSFGTASLWHGNFGTDTELPTVGDFNGDGMDDIATFTRGNTGDVYVALSTGSGFAGTGVLWHGAFAFDDQLPAVGDVNGDGMDDIVTFSRGSDADVYAAVSNGREFIGGAWKWHDLFAPGSELPGTGDFNGDGRTDIVTFTRGNPTDPDPANAYVATSDAHSSGTGAKWHDFFALNGEIPRPTTAF